MASWLVTGSTGTFGRAFVKYVLANTDIQRIVCVSRNEHTQHDMAEELNHDSRLRMLIGDVRDQPRLKRAMEGVEVVVHAAALKRIEIGHRQPIEMIKTNIMGAINVVEASQDANVKKVVALSSDKSVSPVSPYGLSKAMSDALFLNANNTVRSDGPKYAIVKYGNIAGSNGSVIPKWRKMIAAGATKVPVTDPDATRYYMRIEEAVELVNNTIETMIGGEVAIPNLPAYRLGDLAEAMGVEMDIIGLPSWEKLAETMGNGDSSETARRMTVSELREALKSL